MVPGPAGNAVPFGVSARFLLTGVLSLAAACTALALRPGLLLGSYAAPAALALVHTLTLGFAAMVLLGAMHQLMPVLLTSKLHSPRLGTLAYCLFAPGAALIVGGFALGYLVPLLALGGGLVLAAVLVFDYNMWRTARASKARDAVAATMLASAGYLTLTVVMGLLIALGRVSPELAAALGYATPLHLTLGLLGAFFLAISGAGHKLLGMFVLSHGASQSRLRALVWLVHAAAVLAALHTFASLSVLWPAGLFAAAAAALYLLDLRAVLARRMRRQLEIPIRTYLLGPAFLVLTFVLAVLGHYPAAVFSMLGGFVVLSIAGMMVKVGSFLTWQHRYAPRVGKQQVPMLRDMTVAALGRATLWFLGLGAFLATLSLAVPARGLATAGGVAMAIGAWSLTAHIVWIAFAPHRSAGLAERPGRAREAG